jgi:hypothetical protein
MTAKIIPLAMHAFYGAQCTDDSGQLWNAIKVYRDGNVIFLSGPFASAEEAEEAAEAAKERGE